MVSYGLHFPTTIKRKKGKKKKGKKVTGKKHHKKLQLR